MPSTKAVADAYHLLRADKAQDGLVLDPRFKYLRLQIGERRGYLALGYVDATADGPVEVWYGAGKEVLRLRDGRVVGATLAAGKNWSAVSFVGLPRWERIGEAASFERRRDVSPGYRYGLRESMHVRRIPVPSDSQLLRVQPATLTWFEEWAEGADALPRARYGVDLAAKAPRVIYAEQCLFPDACFSWQRWDAASGDGR